MRGPADIRCDIAIVGGGLSGGLIALALATKRPDLDVRIIEPGAALGGNHIWSFFDSDVAAADRLLVEPLVAHRWDGYDVAFPGHRRTLSTPYNSITSEALDTAVRAALPADRIITAGAVSVTPTGAALDNQTKVCARHVIDARGPGDLGTLSLGWQKFVGRTLTVAGGHGLTRPIVMDAKVDQAEGYRFVYCLPFDAETVFVEDTYYSDTPDLDVAALNQRIDAYAAARGWHVTATNRQETGVLPVVLGGDLGAYWASTGETQPKAGLRAGLFHATTGYSLPSAVRLASATVTAVDGPDLASAIRTMAQRQWRSHRFYRLLDTMLFRGAEPADRYRILERFYRLPEPLIERFYAGDSTITDKIRVLSGKPPIPIGRAVGATRNFQWL
jgi:lycopene beta-cyclase